MQPCENVAVPKVVDHQARREEIAQAVWRLVMRGGVSAATVRAVAVESGWSMGAVRYYFSTQAELLLFAAEVMRDRVVLRITRILDEQVPGPDRAAELAEQFLPTDPERLVEVAVWIACMTGRDPRFQELRRYSWDGERYACRIVISDLLGLPRPTGPAESLPEPVEQQVDGLQVTIDGLSMMGTTYPDRAGPQWLRARLRDHLDGIAAALRC